MAIAAHMISGGAGSERRLNRTLMLSLLGAMVALAGMGGGGLALVGARGAQAGKPPVSAGPAAMGTLAPLPPLEFTLSDGQRVRQVELRVVLEMDPSVDKGTVEAHAPRIANALNTSLIDFQPGDLTGPAGTHLVKQQVSLAANRELKPYKVRQVLLQRFLMH